MDDEVVIITTQQAEEADYNLSPSKWVGQNNGAKVGSVPSLIQAFEKLNEQEAGLTSELLRLLRPLSSTGGA